MWFGLRKREVDLDDLIPEAHAFLGEIRLGKSEAEAVRAAGASEEQVRLWKRDPAFRERVRKAKTEGPPKVFWSWRELEELAGDEPAPAAAKHPWMKPEPERAPPAPNAHEAALAALSASQRAVLDRELARSSEIPLQGWGGWR
jgi:hypothetical protein